MKQLLAEFKKFSMRGNVIDLAVGVIIGSAFGKIVSSLVNDIIMPFIGIVSGGINFSNLSLTLAPAKGGREAVLLHYGMFIQNVIDFFIIAISIFLFIKILNRLQRKKSDEPDDVPALTKAEELLQEIRDLLKEKK